MSKEVTCPPCGQVMKADDDDELVSMVQSHAKETRNAELDKDHILASAREVWPYVRFWCRRPDSTGLKTCKTAGGLVHIGSGDQHPSGANGPRCPVFIPSLASKQLSCQVVAQQTSPRGRLTSTETEAFPERNAPFGSKSAMVREALDQIRVL